MKKSFLALATAGLLASGAAAADRLTVYIDDRDDRPVVRVQNSDNDWRSWHDDGRRMDVDQRQSRINARIERGLENGSLTHREARQLRGQLALTEEKERAFEAELHRDLDHLAQRLRFERRDADRRH